MEEKIALSFYQCRAQQAKLKEDETLVREQQRERFGENAQLGQLQSLSYKAKKFLVGGIPVGLSSHQDAQIYKLGGNRQESGSKEGNGLFRTFPHRRISEALTARILTVKRISIKFFVYPINIS